MRVISGKYRGKILTGFDIEGTRPTMDRVKESIFGMIQSYIDDSVVLDLFAGSGALGIEALSNGAKEVYFVDNNIKLIDIIKKNIKGIDGEIHIIKNDYLNVLNDLKNKKFDIIFLDPPYKYNLIGKCLNKIVEYDMLSENGIIVCEYENELIENDSLTLIKEKKYGNKNVRIYKM